MGRKRIEQEERKKKISISLKLKNIKKIDEKTCNRSEYIENLIEKDDKGQK